MSSLSSSEDSRVAAASLPSIPAEGFTVLIPAYRAVNYILPTLAAVAQQTLLPREVIIFEDGRYDDLAELVHAFAATAPFSVRLIGAETNAGVSRARNALLRATRTGLVAFLDADDIWAPDHLATAAAKFSAGADVTFSGVTFIDAAGQIIPGAAEPTAAALADMAPAMFSYNFVQCTSTLCLRRSWIDRVGDFDAKLSHGEDLDLWLRLLAGGANWQYTGRTSCAYRKHPTSAMGQTRLATSRLTAFYEKQIGNPLIPRHQRRRALRDNLWAHARLSWREEPASARAAFWRLVQLEPWNLAAWGGCGLTVVRSLVISPRKPLSGHN